MELDPTALTSAYTKRGKSLNEQKSNVIAASGGQRNVDSIVMADGTIQTSSLNVKPQKEVKKKVARRRSGINPDIKKTVAKKDTSDNSLKDNNIFESEGLNLFSRFFTFNEVLVYFTVVLIKQPLIIYVLQLNFQSARNQLNSMASHIWVRLQ